VNTLDEARWLADAEAQPILQGSPEWFAMRLGKVTASRIADVMAKPRVPGAGMRVNYLWQLATERLTGLPMKTYQSKTMLEAHDWEPIARAAYAFKSDNHVHQVPFVDHNDIPNCGCSPDGLVNGDGLVEIKCPELTAHYDTLLREVIPAEYLKQMQFQMACCKRKWCDYVSFNADLPENMRVAIIRCPRDVDMISEMEAEVRKFQAELAEKVGLLREKFPS
jgi:putative phage-type endonuclease